MRIQPIFISLGKTLADSNSFHWALGTAAMSRYRMLKDDNLLSHIEEIKRHLCLVAASQYGLER